MVLITFSHACLEVCPADVMSVLLLLNHDGEDPIALTSFVQGDCQEDACHNRQVETKQICRGTGEVSMLLLDIFLLKIFLFTSNYI